MLQNNDVAIIAADPDDSTRIGSGILIAANLVLTARHVVMAANNPQHTKLFVRLLRSPHYAEGSVTWRSEVEDLALIELYGKVEQPAFEYKLCEISHRSPISNVTMIGFPLAVVEKDVPPRDYSVTGSLRRESEDGTLSFSANVADIPWIQARWRGMSGAGLYTPGPVRNRNLYGVVSEARKAFPFGKLYIAPIRKNDAETISNVAHSRSPTNRRLRSCVLSDDLAAKVITEFDFSDGLYKFATSASLDDRESLNEFEIEIALGLELAEIQTVIRGEEQRLERVSPRSVLPSAETDYKRVLIYLQAPGGYGKTSFLKRVISASIDDGIVAFYLDVKSEKKPEWKTVENLFFDCASQGCNYESFSRAVSNPQFRTLLVIDGLNEAAVSWTDISRMLAKLADNHSRVSIIAADRMNPDRMTLPKGFTRGTPLPIQVERVSGLQMQFTSDQIRQQRLFRVPFFLDKLYKLADSGHENRDLLRFGRAQIIQRYFERYAGPLARGGSKLDELVDALAAAAMQAYVNKTLELPSSWASKNKKLVKELKDLGLISGASDKPFFSHQLLHDYLVGRWLAKNGRSVWDADNFDRVTLDARSFDVLELASELIGAEADGLVINVYDWNYRAAIECILNLDAGVGGRPSPLPMELKEAIFAMRAEKMFDVFNHTRRSARAKVQEFRSDFGISYSKLEAPKELIAAIRDSYRPSSGSDGLYVAWYKLFVQEDSLSSDQWPRILDSPLLGWTAASVFRREGVLTADLVRHLSSLYHALWRSQPDEYGPGIAVRWRIVHVMGASDSDEAVDLLTSIVDTAADDEWVLYGTTRSLAEIASRAPTEEHARRVLRPIVTKLPNLTEKVRKEVRDVSILSGRPPDWWALVYGEVLDSGLELASQKDGDELLAWQTAIETFNRTYARET